METREVNARMGLLRKDVIGNPAFMANQGITPMSVFSNTFQIIPTAIGEITPGIKRSTEKIFTPGNPVFNRTAKKTPMTKLNETPSTV
jgi:hypothetical protein